MQRNEFLERHHNGPMIRMPDAWDPGSAKIMQAAGVEALGTTSAGIVYTQGLPDYEGALSRDECLRVVQEMTDAVTVPISVDSEDGYGDTPEDVAETFKMMIEAGAMGGSIEDHQLTSGRELIMLEETADRVRAAREAIDRMGAPFVLTARAECFLVGYPVPLDESIRRLKLYEDASADCLYVPDVRSREQITAVLDALTKPVNILVGIKSFDIPLDELETMGVRRISTGGSIMCSILGLIRSTVGGLGAGTLDYLDNMIRHDELTKLFSGTNVSGI